MSTNWKNEIVKLASLKEKLNSVDKECLWPWHLPEVGANEEELLSLEKALNHRIDIKYRTFLTYANGWQGFFHDIDLFGTGSFCDHHIYRRAIRLLNSLDLDSLRANSLKKDDLLPIAVSLYDIDLIVLLKNSSSDSPVIWFAGGEVERFSDFEQFFLAMIEFTYEDIEDLGEVHAR